jgi:hypothetical protein
MRLDHILGGFVLIALAAGTGAGCSSESSATAGDGGPDASGNGGAAGGSAGGKGGASSGGKGGASAGGKGGAGTGGKGGASAGGVGGKGTGGAAAGGAGGKGAGGTSAGGASAGGTTASGGAGGAPVEAGKPCTGSLCSSACAACEKQQCALAASTSGASGSTDCCDAPSTLAGHPAAAGPALGIDKGLLFADVLACYRRENCAVLGGTANAPSSVEACYCGATVPFNTCAGGTVQGPCKDAIEAAAETTKADQVLARMLDPQYAAGAAIRRIAFCDQDIFCRASCYPGVDAGP